MNKNQILLKAVTKAQANGWDHGHKMVDVHYFGSGMFVIETLGQANYYSVFDKDFAGALWGEEEIMPVGKAVLYGQPAWKLHLQQMVIANDEIKYLEANT